MMSNLVQAHGLFEVSESFLIDQPVNLFQLKLQTLPIQSFPEFQTPSDQNVEQSYPGISPAFVQKSECSSRKRSRDSLEKVHVSLADTKINIRKKRKKESRLLIQPEKVLANQQFYYDHIVTIKNGSIHSITPIESVVINDSDEVHYYPTGTLAPGFIDILTHGANGYDVMDETAESIEHIASALPQEGTTSFLPSTMTDTVANTKRAALNIWQATQFQSPLSAAIIGWHAEGPYFSEEKIGCHDPACRREPDIRELSKLQSLSHGLLKIVTVAPELPGAVKMIQWAARHGIVASIGHTMADCDTSLTAISAGARLATHLYNAMNEGDHHTAGCTAAIHIHPHEIMYTLIIDGFHIARPKVHELSLMRGFANRAILITDGISAKYKPDGHYTFGHMKVVVEQSVARLVKGKNLAGSTLKMNEAVANIQNFTQQNVSREQALLMASHNPARVLGIQQQKGLISPGLDADLVVLDDREEVLATYRNGQLIYSAPLSP